MADDKSDWETLMLAAYQDAMSRAESLEGAFSLTRLVENTGERYTQGDLIGEGAKKQVYYADELSLKRPVALALLKDFDEEYEVESFFKEALLTASLQHPGIVPIYDIGFFGENRRPYFTMKLYEGKDLAAVLADWASGVTADNSDILANKLDIFGKVCDAVALAHSFGILHLDIKPENIRVNSFGEVLLCDWGLAKIQEDRCTIPVLSNLHMTSALHSKGTMHGYVCGTPGYMAPEQCLRQTKTVHTDIYALGALLYSLLTGADPIQAADADGKIQNTIVGDILPPSKRFPGRNINESLDAICMKALAKDPADRYAKVEALQGDIQAFLGGFITSAENASFGKQLVKLVARHKAISATAAISLSVLITATTWFVGTLSISEQNAIESERLAKASEKQVIAHYETLEASLKRETELKLERSQLLYAHAWAKYRGTCDTYTPKIDAELITLIDTVLAGDPDLKGAWRLKGLLLLMQQDFAGAERCFRTSGPQHAEFTELAANYRPVTDGGALDTPRLLELVQALTEMTHIKHNHRLIAAVLARDPDNHAFRIGAVKAVNPGQETWNVVYDHATRSLDLSGNALLVDLFPLSGSDVKRLDLSQAAKFGKIRPYLASLPLTHLDLSYTRVSRIPDFEHALLIVLHLRHSQLASLDFIKGTNIEVLSITNIPCTNLDPVRTLINLKTLYCTTRQANSLRHKMDLDSINLVIEAVH